MSTIANRPQESWMQFKVQGSKKSYNRTFLTVSTYGTRPIYLTRKTWNKINTVVDIVAAAVAENHKDSLAASVVVSRKGSVEDNRAAAAAEAGIVGTAAVAEALQGRTAECHCQPEPSHSNDPLGNRTGCLAAAARAIRKDFGRMDLAVVVAVAAVAPVVVGVAEPRTGHRTAASAAVVVAAAPLVHHPSC